MLNKKITFFILPIVLISFTIESVLMAMDPCDADKGVAFKQNFQTSIRIDNHIHSPYSHPLLRI